MSEITGMLLGVAVDWDRADIVGPLGGGMGGHRQAG